MYIEMIDLLRCPRDHEETWLVAAFTTMDGRFVVEGKLGCPICHASYEIIDGIPRFADYLPSAAAAAGDADAAIRTAALLNLTRAGSVAVLCGSDAAVAGPVAEMTQCRVIVLNPASRVEESERVGVVFAGGRIPLASSSVDGIAIGDCDSFLGDAARALRPSARFTASAHTRLPDGFRELARDATHVVAEFVGPLVSLSRNR